MDIEAAGRDAHLAVVAELAGHRDLRSGLRVGIREDNERRVAAQFETDTLHLVRGAAHQLLADFGRAGEAELAADGVFQKLVADLLRRAHDQVGDTRRQPRFDHVFEEQNQT